ncbi:PspC domain-containing protein [Saccharomonospora piscinae]|uniref:PspC domain-containing protein n=1 Tax=Saccharomonospora piscinae TaxID=687388 RepID=UPI0004641588|nr:PspC domain-containing protein [Saccharomonospora piscinae]
MENTATTRTLTRARDNRMLGGVCAGIARRYGWKRRNVRLAFILSCVLPGPQFLLYAALWLVLPEEA